MNHLPAVTGAGWSFRAKLLLAMMLVVSVTTMAGVYLVHRNVAADAERDLRQDFQSELTALHRAEEVRHAALAESCRTLVAKPRLHAALEDNALDLLYPSAKDELRDLMNPGDNRNAAPGAPALQATFYRFLAGRGVVIPPPNPTDAGPLSQAEELQLTLPNLPAQPQIGYLWRSEARTAETVDEIIAMPIVSTETNDVISALVIGFKPVELENRRDNSGIKSGIWVDERLRLASLSPTAQADLGQKLTEAVRSGESENSFAFNLDQAPYLVFHKRLNPGSLFPPAHEVSLYPLQPAFARQRKLQWGIVLAGVGLLVCGFIGSHFLSARLSAPVQRLEVESEENRAERKRAEAALGLTREELQRSERFSADASHQLKSPVTVLRAGIESLLAREGFPRETYDELSSLLHQTYRLTGVVDDLLLLSRMDAGHLQINFTDVNLTALVEEWLDDLSVLADDWHIKVEKEIPGDLYVTAERRYASLIVQNLLENARKYNRRDGRIRVVAHAEGEGIYLCVGNTGRSIPPAAQEHIFERFHRAAVGESVPGHGLGLNLARDLARLHGGDLRLARSQNDWTEFEVRFRAAVRSRPTAAAAARST